MNIHPSTDPWAKLVILDPSKREILFPKGPDGQNIYEVPGRWRIHQISNGSIWILNLSSSKIRVYEDWLEKDKAIELYGGEIIFFDNLDGNSEYIFCPIKEQLKNELKRSRDEVDEAKNKLVKVEKKSQEELKCPICLEILQECSMIIPCNHNVCNCCLINHLKGSVDPSKDLAKFPTCPMCRGNINFITKNTLICNIAEMILEIFPNLQGPQEPQSRSPVILQGEVLKLGGALFIQTSRINDRKSRGTLIDKNQVVYEGTWIDISQYGYGTAIYVNGDIYKGEWKNSKREGKGVLNYTDGTKYEGQWVNDCIHGEGTMTGLKGMKYTGSWKNGKKNGFGTMTWADGEQFEGNWEDDVISKFGISKYLNGDMHKGEWKNGQMEGKGEFTLQNGDIYEGTWIKNRIQPVVRIRYNNGDIYEGEINPFIWQKQGKGVLTFKNGDQYHGHWSNDQYFGPGTYTSKEEKIVYVEFWMNGILVEKLKMT